VFIDGADCYLGMLSNIFNRDGIAFNCKDLLGRFKESETISSYIGSLPPCVLRR
jgi:hypothetical protein